MYETFEEVCYVAVTSAYRRVAPERARQVGYGIMCLAESNALLLSLGFDKPAGRTLALQPMPWSPR